MSESMDRILEGKQRFRRQLAALPFEEKVALTEKMRDRSLSIASSPLRTQIMPIVAAVVVVATSCAGEVQFYGQTAGLTPPTCRSLQDQSDNHQTWVFATARYSEQSQS